MECQHCSGTGLENTKESATTTLNPSEQERLSIFAFFLSICTMAFVAVIYARSLLFNPVLYFWTSVQSRFSRSECVYTINLPTNIKSFSQITAMKHAALQNRNHDQISLLQSPQRAVFY